MNNNNNGLTGLANMGNTCYINSSMQILSHCEKLNIILKQFNKENIYNKDENASLFLEWKDLNDMMWYKNCTIAPKRFISIIQKVSLKKNIDLFTGYAQNDLPEFLLFIIDSFHDALKREVKINVLGETKNELDILAKSCFNMIKELYSKNYSEIFELFYGINVSLITDMDDTILSCKSEPYSTINLSIPNKKSTCTLYECFDFFTNYEILDEDNKWFNEKTGLKQVVKKSIKFWNFPEILIVNINRFDNSNKKINTLVTIHDTNINLSKYVLGYNKSSYTYELFGICNHNGNCYGGHYYSYVKNNGKWYEFNDTIIAEINVDKIITNKAYCFFFKKIEI